MKRIFFILVMTLITLALITVNADAQVSGACSGCHTMHNSQDSSSMNYDASTTPNSQLLRGDCIGCHAQNTANNIVNGQIPQVLHTNGTDLAGGNFSYVIATEGKGHNVEALSGMAQDTQNGRTPPGYNAGYDPSTGGFNTGNALTCAGTNGCHGNRDQANEWTSVNGAHHGDDSILKYGAGFTLTGQGASVETSYRYLYRIKGAEDSDWHATWTTTDHNEYLGEIYASRGTTDAWANMKGTISELCSECHADYHVGGLTGDSGIGTASPWARHPTDVIIPNTGEYASISNTYDDETPVARPSTFFADALASASSAVAANTDRVMCLSCHRAHGSDFADNLRFDYSTLAAGEGCLHCHTSKDTY